MLPLLLCLLLSDDLSTIRSALADGQPEQALTLADKAVKDQPQSAQAWLLRGQAHEMLRRFEEARQDLDKAVERDPKLADAYQQRGTTNFMLGKMKESLADFDRYLELRPAMRARHWQRGITCYYLGEFDEGRKQFQGYEQVDTNDVENAVWHYLCNARLVGKEKARQEMLKIGKDNRVPMMQVYDLFAGKLKPADILTAIDQPSTYPLEKRRFYGHLYLGLYWESEGDRLKTLEHLTEAGKQNVGQHYMWDVARVHRQRLLAPRPQDTPRRASRPTKPAGPFVKQWHATGKQGVVVAGGPESVAIGLEILKAGGNAADAAAATLMAQTVTDAHNYCFGGEVPIIVHNAQRHAVEVLSGQGAAPRLATREFFVQRQGIPKFGTESPTVPAVLDALVTLLERHGTRTFADITTPTIAVLERNEQPWHADMARTLRRLIDAEKEAGGDRLRGLRLVADCFYRGPIAHDIDSWARAEGSLLRYSDLATHVTRVEEPLRLDYRGHTIYKCGAWTQGPFLLQSLQLLEGFDLKSLADTADAIHLQAEAMKLALADRDVYLADPLFVDVPLREMLAPGYATLRRPLIDLQHASLVQRPGDPRRGKALLEGADLRHGLAGPTNDTTTCMVADGKGNVVTATPSGWSGVLAGKTGVWLGSRLQSFNTWQGHPNCIEPGKRPRITLTPTLVLKDGKPAYAISVAGGDLQDQVTLQLLVQLLDYGRDAQKAVTAPRFSTDHHVGSFGQAAPKLGDLVVNPTVGEKVLNELKSRGHKVDAKPAAIGAPSVLRINPTTGEMEVAGDPRSGRHAAGF